MVEVFKPPQRMQPERSLRVIIGQTLVTLAVGRILPLPGPIELVSNLIQGYQLGSAIRDGYGPSRGDASLKPQLSSCADCPARLYRVSYLGRELTYIEDHAGRLRAELYFDGRAPRPLRR